MKHNLHTLVVLHYVYGAFVCLIGSVLLVLVILGSAMHCGSFMDLGENPPPHWVGSFLQGLGMFLFVFVEAKGIMNLISASLISRRKGRTFTYVTAALNCLNIPFGLALAIFTFIAMGDKEVRVEYGLVDCSSRSDQSRSLRSVSTRSKRRSGITHIKATSA